MKFILTILILVMCSPAMCPASAETLIWQAHHCRDSNKYDSAIHFYLLLKNNYPAYEATFTLYRLGDCYKKLGDEKTAEKYFLECLATEANLDSIPYGKYLSAWALGDMYLERKEFTKALTYYDSTPSINRLITKMTGCGTGWRHMKYKLATRKAACFRGLGRYDSVAKILLPYMFQDYVNIYIGDTLEVDSLSRVYANAVVKAYGREQSKRKLQEAVDNLLYRISDAAPEAIVINCTLEYFGKLDVLKDQQAPRELVEALKLTKELIRKEITSSPAYRLIMYDDCLTPANSPL